MLNYELNIFISHLPGRIQDRIRSFLTRNSEKQLGCFHACMTMINIYLYPLPKSTATEIKNKCTQILSRRVTLMRTKIILGIDVDFGLKLFLH